MNILAVHNITKQFGGLVALDNVSFTVPEGQITALIGPNGSGKTTMFNVITGAYPATAGQITYLDERIDGKFTETIVKLGLARTFQIIRLFKNLSVLENVMLGLHLKGNTGFLQGVLGTSLVKKENRHIREEAETILEQLGLAHLRYVRASELPAGQGRLVEIARALGTNPRLLLLDEPAAGLNPDETEDLAERLNVILTQGKTILIVEHDMGLVMSIAKKIIVLSSGKHLATGTPEEIQNNEDVISVYLGRSHTKH
jgi:ABC-type branched-subunit amino acid transport system ATPase component